MIPEKIVAYEKTLEQRIFKKFFQERAIPDRDAFCISD